jgi:hypothetical protein
MIIYSVMPMEMIMKQAEEPENPLRYEEAEVGGIKMLVERTASAPEAKIVRLLSTNPQDFLNPHYMPGQTIHFRPEISK